ncbi:MAG: acetate uptake transporter [Thermoplasmata archaeon]
MTEAPPRVEEKPEWWGTPAVVGLMGFGTTTMIAGLTNLPAPFSNGFANNWVVFGMAAAFGGTAQFVAGVIALRKGNVFAGSAFIGYGSFWLAFTLMLTQFVSQAGTTAISSGVIFYGVSGFAFIWMLFTITFLINAPKHGWVLTGVFFFLVIAFLLLVIKFWQIGQGDTLSTGESWAIGGEIFFDGLLAWYLATADLTNWNWGRKVLPT